LSATYCSTAPVIRALTQTIEVIREKVHDGVTGEYRDLAYTQCKIVGNGSFGVVFQTKLSPSGEDAAIKRVLQDKRFKVNVATPAVVVSVEHPADVIF
jgi:serine/threonine protein kinase